MKGMNYKKFRESKKEHFITKDGQFTRQQVIKMMADWLNQNPSSEPEDFLEALEVKEIK